MGMSSEDETGYTKNESSEEELPAVNQNQLINQEQENQAFQYLPPQTMLPSHHGPFYSEQEFLYQSLLFQPFPQFISGALPQSSSDPHASYNISNISNQAINRQPQRITPTEPTGGIDLKIYRHKKAIDNLSISSGLNTVHIKDEPLKTMLSPILQIKREGEEGTTVKKLRLQPNTELKESELNMRNIAIDSLRQRIEIDDFARNLMITIPDIESFQNIKRPVKKSQERERNKGIFAIRCLLECFESIHESLNLNNFQSRVLTNSINSVSTSRGVPSSSVQQSKSQNVFVATPRSVIYSSYMLLCDICNVEYLGQSGIGKLVRIAFPLITTKRLGTRGNSKYHYVGIKAKPWVKELAEVYDLGNFQIPDQRSTITGVEHIHDLEFGEKIDSNEFGNIFEKPKSSSIKPGQEFTLDFNFFERINDPMVSRFYVHLSNGDIDKMIEFIMKLSDDVELHNLYYHTLLFLSPLSYQLGENNLLNNLNYTSSNLNAFHSLNTRDFNSTRYFTICLGRLVKSSRCSLSLSNVLFLYHQELSNNFRVLSIGDIINLEVDDILGRFLFLNFFKNFQNFLINIPALLNATDEEDPENDTIQYSEMFSKFNKLIMRNFVEFLIIEIRKFETKNLKYLIMSFSRIITSINDEVLRNNDLNMNFNNWWILNCWLNEWLNFCCEFVAFKDNIE